jgi:tetratricopeptide (TPR) repeat protein
MFTTTAEEPMQGARRTGLQIELKGLLIPISIGVMALLRFIFQVPIWVLMILCIWIPIYYLGYPWMLRKKWYAFEKEFAFRFQKGEYKQLLELYSKQWFLRRFGPKTEMLGKLGLIYSALERYRDAEQVLERAIEATPQAQRDRLYFNLANVKFELGKYEAAEQIYRALRPDSPYRHSSQTYLAIIDLHRGRRTEIARRILEREQKRAVGQLKQRIEQALAL